MNATARLPYDIAIVGLGITGVHQITREAEETIRRCQRAFVADTAPGVLRYVRTLSHTVTDLSSRFRPGIHRASNYQAIASDVVDAALETSPVCFATYGHPKMFSYPTVLIQPAAAILNLKVRVIPGISFLDTLLVDLGVDPGFDGLQMYEATDLLVRDRPLQTDVGCVITQASVVIEPREGQPAAGPEALRRFQEYLLSFYPADHDVVMVTSRTHPLLEPLVRKIRLETLAAVLANGSYRATLYIPPVQRRPVADEQLADLIREASHG
jgi:uncharacterized protein YabN with tetrapyrrole methylase and pyrophosphatase domain